MYGSTKVGIVREPVPALAALPARQPDDGQEDRVLEHESQPARTHVMRRERPFGLTTRARLNATRTIRSAFPDLCVMFVQLRFSFRTGQIDAHADRLFVLEERGPVGKTDLAPLFMRSSADTKKEAGF